jgi:hypothetical protein
VHGSASTHDVPFASAVHAVVDRLGWHDWHEFAGLRVPIRWKVRSILHPCWHVPPGPHENPAQQCGSSVQGLPSMPHTAWARVQGRRTPTSKPRPKIRRARTMLSSLSALSGQAAALRRCERGVNIR